MIAIIIVHNIEGQAQPSYLLANVGPEPEEFPVDPVESRLQEVPLARVLRVEEIEQVQDELLVDVPLHQRWLQEVTSFKGLVSLRLESQLTLPLT